MTTTLEGNIIKKAHSAVDYTEEQLEELSMCMPECNKDAHHYFMTTFGFLKHPKKGKMVYVPYNYQIELIDNFHNYRFNINMLGRQMGKALDGNTPILTKNGYKPMSDINVGDKVYGSNGKLCNVINKTKPQINRKCYSITFGNGESIVADENHSWVVYDLYDDCHIKTTKELLDNFAQYYITMSKPLEEVVDTNGRISDIDYMRNVVINAIRCETTIITEDNKAVLTNEPKLLERVRTLLSMLGVVSEYSDYSLIFSIDEFDGKIPSSLNIVSIEPVESRPVYCIEVDSPDRVYLCGITLIPTHNCVIADTIIKLKNKETGEEIEMSIGDFHQLIKREA